MVPYGLAIQRNCNWQKSLTWATKYFPPPAQPPAPTPCTPFYLYIVASRSKVGLHIVLVKAKYSVFIKYACYACANYRKNNMASIFNLPQHSLLVPFLEGFEKIFLGMEFFNSPFGHIQIIALICFWWYCDLRIDHRNSKQKASYLKFTLTLQGEVGICILLWNIYMIHFRVLWHFSCTAVFLPK